jgi:hypothetical protein
MKVLRIPSRRSRLSHRRGSRRAFDGRTGDRRVAKGESPRPQLQVTQLEPTRATLRHRVLDTPSVGAVLETRRRVEGYRHSSTHPSNAEVFDLDRSGRARLLPSLRCIGSAGALPSLPRNGLG